MDITENNLKIKCNVKMINKMIELGFGLDELAEEGLITICGPATRFKSNRNFMQLTIDDGIIKTLTNNLSESDLGRLVQWCTRFRVDENNKLDENYLRTLNINTRDKFIKQLKDNNLVKKHKLYDDRYIGYYLNPMVGTTYGEVNSEIEKLFRKGNEEKHLKFPKTRKPLSKVMIDKIT